MDNFHLSVLLHQVLDLSKVKKGEKYIDATLGGGGHTKAILDAGGVVLGIDQDQEAIDFVKANLEQEIKSSRLVLAKGNFADLEKIAHLHGFTKVGGVFFDLGVSSHQLDTQRRGFSFLSEGPLDMRMDKDLVITAEYLVNILEKGELDELFNRLGQESRSRAISNGIVSARRVKAIRTTNDFLEVLKKAYGFRGNLSDYQKNLIAQKAFQALRIAVNNELGNLEKALPQALNLIRNKGRIAVISFHSIEDGIVKKSFKAFEKQNMGYILTQKPIVALEEEQKINVRSKSAKLRVFEKK